MAVLQVQIYPANDIQECTNCKSIALISQFIKFFSLFWMEHWEKHLKNIEGMNKAGLSSWLQKEFSAKVKIYITVLLTSKSHLTWCGMKDYGLRWHARQ